MKPEYWCKFLIFSFHNFYMLNLLLCIFCTKWSWFTLKSLQNKDKFYLRWLNDLNMHTYIHSSKSLFSKNALLHQCIQSKVGICVSSTKCTPNITILILNSNTYKALHRVNIRNNHAISWKLVNKSSVKYIIYGNYIKTKF